MFDLRDSVAAPSEAVRALGDGLASGELSRALATALEAYAQALTFSVVVGVAVRVAIGRSRSFSPRPRL